MNSRLVARYKGWKAQWPERFDRPWVRGVAWLEAMVIDHGVLRPLWNNPRAFAAGAFRSHHPNRRQLRRLGRRGLKTVVNLRGLGVNGATLFEREACDEAGIRLVGFRMTSRSLPSRERLLAFAQLVEQAASPILFHCKSGADRAGFAAALYLLLRGDDVSVAKQQLSWRYLHFKGAATGRLDAFVDAYQQAFEATGVGFLTWVQTEYDPDEIQRNFKPRGLSTWLVDKVLMRE